MSQNSDIATGGRENGSSKGKGKGGKKMQVTTGMDVSNTKVQYAMVSEQLKQLNQRTPHPLITVNRSQLQNIPPDMNIVRSSSIPTLNDFYKNQQSVPKSNSFVSTGDIGASADLTSKGSLSKVVSTVPTKPPQQVFRDQQQQQQNLFQQQEQQYKRREQQLQEQAQAIIQQQRQLQALRDEQQQTLTLLEQQQQVLRERNERAEVLRQQNERAEAVLQQNEQAEALHQQNEQLVILHQQNQEEQDDLERQNRDNIVDLPTLNRQLVTLNQTMRRLEQFAEGFENAEIARNRRAVTLPLGMPFRNLNDYNVFNQNNDQAIFNQLIGFFKSLGGHNIKACVSLYFHASFHGEETFSLQIPFARKNPNDPNTTVLKTSRFADACYDALIGNAYIINLQRDEFNVQLYLAYKALQNRYRRRMARNNGEPPRRRRRNERRDQNINDSDDDNDRDADPFDENQQNE